MCTLQDLHKNTDSFFSQKIFCSQRINFETKLEIINLQLEIEKCYGIVWFINVFSSALSLLDVPPIENDKRFDYFQLRPSAF